LSSSDIIKLQRRNRIAVITLNRPQQRNALSVEMRALLARRLDEIDDEVGVVVLRGEGAAFCAGADLGDVPDTPMAWRDRIVTAQTQHLRIINMKQTVIAVVQGAAFGGGASLALAADILVMDENASLGFPFVKLGVIPDGGASFLLQAKASPAIALDVLLTGGVIRAEEARALGLTRRVAPAGELEAHAMKLADELAALPTEALQLTKSVCAQGWAAHLAGALRHEADAFGLATASDGHRTAMVAAKAKVAKVK
jgi:enoyl-CoA hydratase/carnithine racemase